MQRIRYTLTLVVISLFTVLFSSWVNTTNPVNRTPGLENASTFANIAVAGEPTPRSTDIRPTASDKTYFFTMTLPTHPGQRFAKVSFDFTEQSQSKGINPIRFDLANTKAFLGTPDAQGRAIAVESAWVDETGSLWVEFKPTLLPQTTFTLALTTQSSTPKTAYEFGVAAYPATQRPVALFVGDGIVTIK